MKRIVVVFFLLISSLAAKAQKPFVLGVVDSIQSTELAEKRILNIYLPDEYKDSTQKKYPVIYLLDGSANEDFVHTVGVVQFLTMIGTMQPTIVVGIANVDRKRDFTFPTTVEKDKKDFPTTGGSAKFIGFLENELQPYIDKKYRTTDSKTIIGQSLGGLLACEILITKPDLFSMYVIVSPSLWWDNESLLKRITALKYNSKKVYILIGNEEKQMVEDTKVLSDKLLNLTHHNVYYNYLSEENHLTILHNAIYMAFVLEMKRRKK